MDDHETPCVQDPVNAPVLTILNEHGRAALGMHANKQWYEDPRHLLFSMARYKFVAKMLSGFTNVLEVGAGDGFNSRIVLQEVEALALIDIDPLFVADAAGRNSPEWNCRTAVHDMLAGPFPGQYDAIYALDVLEHIKQTQEHVLLENALASLAPHGLMLVGMPSIESQALAKSASITGHINCKSLPDLKALMRRYFHNVFMFSMNDEIVHTGHHRMAHYILALCCTRR